MINVQPKADRPEIFWELTRSLYPREACRRVMTRRYCSALDLARYVFMVNARDFKDRSL